MLNGFVAPDSGSKSVSQIPVGKPPFETATEQFEDFDDRDISFVDYTTSILADERGIERLFAFDSDFRTLGLSLVPKDVILADE